MQSELTVLAGLVFIVTQRAVEGREVSQLLPLQLVLAFGDGCGLRRLAMRDTEGQAYRFNDVRNQLLRLVHLFLGVCHDQAVQILLLITGVSSVRPAFAFFHGSFASDRNLCAGVGFHFLERVATRTN
jgi:hypothetical protein